MMIVFHNSWWFSAEGRGFDFKDYNTICRHNCGTTINELNSERLTEAARVVNTPYIQRTSANHTPV